MKVYEHTISDIEALTTYKCTSDQVSYCILRTESLGDRYSMILGNAGRSDTYDFYCTKNNN